MEPESSVKYMLSWSICHAVWGLRYSVAKLTYTQATLGVEPERAVFSGTVMETAVRAKERGMLALVRSGRTPGSEEGAGSPKRTAKLPHGAILPREDRGQSLRQFEWSRCAAKCSQHARTQPPTF